MWAEEFPKERRVRTCSDRSETEGVELFVSKCGQKNSQRKGWFESPPTGQIRRGVNYLVRSEERTFLLLCVGKEDENSELKKFRMFLVISIKQQNFLLK